MRLAGLGQKNALTLTGQGHLTARLSTSAPLLCARSKEAGAAAAFQLSAGPVCRSTAAVCFLVPCFSPCGGLGYSRGHQTHGLVGWQLNCPSGYVYAVSMGQNLLCPEQPPQQQQPHPACAHEHSCPGVASLQGSQTRAVLKHGCLKL